MKQKQFGKKIIELLDIVNETENWEEYVSTQTVEIIKQLQTKNNIIELIEELDMKYTTVHAHLIRALKRITAHNLEFLRDGKSPNAQKLFELMTHKKWKDSLTNKEIEIAESFERNRNFYTCGKELKIAPSNIAAILYGNTQKRGVIKKIEDCICAKNITVVVKK